MRRNLLALLATSAALLASCRAPARPVAQPAPPTRHSYAPSDVAVLNPERGFYQPMDLIGSNDFGAVRVRGYTLIRSYVRLDAYREQDLPQTLLDNLDAALSAVRAGGIKVIVRFSYNFGPYPNSEPDAAKPQMLKHIEQLAPVLRRNADVIAWMEAGFVGAWGEWHTSTHGIDKSLSDKRDVLGALLKALPLTRMVQLRYPADIIRLFDTPLAQGEAFSQSDKARVGHHNDCFLASDNDWGTYEREGSDTRERAQRFLAEQLRFTPMGGETCNDNPPRSDCENALREMALLRFTEINLDYHPQVISGWNKQKCFDVITRRLGYHIALTSAEFPERLRATGTLPITITLENSGFAAPVNPRLAIIVLDGPRRIELPLTAIDPRRWEPGAHVIAAQLVLPADLPEGSYRLALWLPDPEPALRARPEYAIRTVNDGLWHETAGDNTLSGRLQVEP